MRHLTGQKRPRNGTSAVKDKNGYLLTEKDDIKDRWQQYIEVLYDSEGKPLKEKLGIEDEREVDTDSKGPNLLDSEIKIAIKELKNGKAVGIDGLSAEYWQT